MLMRGLRRTFFAAVLACGAGACEVVAGIEDLQLTAGEGGAATVDGASDGAGDTSADATMGDSAGGADAHVQGDASLDASRDAPAEGGVDAIADSAAGIDGAEASLTYVQEVLLDQPVAYWRFGEASGTTAYDSSGHGNDGTYEGTVTLGTLGAIANDPNTAATFDGMTGFMNAGNVFEFAGAGACSFEAWVDPVIDDSFHEVLSRSDGQGGSTSGYLMYIEPDSDPAMMDFAIYSGGEGNIAESNTTIDGGAYTHVVGVYDGSNVYIYANGVLLMQHATSLTIPTTVNPFVVAAQSGGMTDWFHGAIDEVAVYGAVLPASRILVHYRVGIGLPP
jgi:hypothetical protein